MNYYYQVEAAHSQADVENGQCDMIDIEDTLKAAKQRAKYLLTAEYAKVTEMSEPFGYVRIMRNGTECVADFYGKGAK